MWLASVATSVAFAVEVGTSDLQAQNLQSAWCISSATVCMDIHCNHKTLLQACITVVWRYVMPAGTGLQPL